MTYLTDTDRDALVACICPHTDGYRIKRRGCPKHAEKDAAYWIYPAGDLADPQAKE